jgi:hypothetical protein
MRSAEEDETFHQTSSPDEIVQMLKINIEVVRQPDTADDEPERQFDSDLLTDARLHAGLGVESIRFDSHMRCFLVRGSGEIVHMVKLGSKPTCSCRPVGSCYHISAVMIATGLKDKVRRPTMNLTLLRQNKRRIKQKAGRKHPRPGDYDVSSAPDAIEKLRASPNREELPGQLPETKETDRFENDSDTDFISSIANTE